MTKKSSVMSLSGLILTLFVLGCQVPSQTVEYRPIGLLVENLDAENWVTLRVYYNDIPLLQTSQLYPNNPDYTNNPRTPNLKSYGVYVPTSDVTLKVVIVATGNIKEQAPKLEQTFKITNDSDVPDSAIPNIKITYDGAEIKIEEEFPIAE